MRSLAVEKFGRGELERLSGDEKKIRLFELAKVLESKIPEFDLEYKWHDELPFIVQELKDIGHDIWQWDTNDGIQLWGGDYIRPKTAGKLVVTFIYPATVEVGWDCESTIPWPPVECFYSRKRGLRDDALETVERRLNQRLSEYEKKFWHIATKSLGSYLIDTVECLIDELNRENYMLGRLDESGDKGIDYRERTYCSEKKMGTGLSIHFKGFSATVSWIEKLPTTAEH